MYLCLDDPLHDLEERLVLLALVDALEPLVPVPVGLLQRHVQVGVGLLRRQVYHIKLGVNVHQPALQSKTTIYVNVFAATCLGALFGTENI